MINDVFFPFFRQWLTFIARTSNADEEKWNFLQQSGTRQISPGWWIRFELSHGFASGKDDELMQAVFHCPWAQWLVHQTREVKRVGQRNGDEHDWILSHQHCKSKLTLALNFKFKRESITRTSEFNSTELIYSLLFNLFGCFEDFLPANVIMKQTNIYVKFYLHKFQGFAGVLWLNLN